MTMQIITDPTAIKDRISELENILDDYSTISHEELVELYYLRDIDMELDPKKVVEWGLHKLCNGNKDILRRELLLLRDSSDNYNFYKTCTLEELFCLGY